jgi:leader peptidase (prepilin peptidase) / N-methyltransferase
MKLILALPMEARLAFVFVLGACIGAAANWAIYRLAWNRRPIGPWCPADPAAPPRRRPFDRLPILGWLGLRREAGLHGAGFWGRPMLLEVLTGVGLAALYWWEIGAAALLPAGVAPPSQSVLHLQFASHCILIGLMLAGSMIDVDEMTIPDEITVVGTLVGLLLAAVAPWSLLPVDVPLPGGQVGLTFLHLTSPSEWPAWLDGRQAGSLGLGLGCWWLWCMALLPRTWYARHGWRRAAALCWTRLRRDPNTRRILSMGLIGTLAVALVWYCDRTNWQGLLTALVGMAAAGGLVWAVRIVGAATLRREAMGFGDVTLMAMLGAFLGWQSGFVIFFLAPLAGLVIALARLVLFRNREIPFGPFLCLATLFVIVRWEAVWGYTKNVFDLGWLVPLAVVFCLGLMGLMLATWQLLRSAIAGGPSRRR